MKKFLCYDTNDAASGKIGVNSNGVLKPNSTVPSTNGSSYQQLVTDGKGGVKWEDRLAYADSRLSVDLGDGAKAVKVSDEVPSWVSMDAPMKVWVSDGTNDTATPEQYTDLGNGNFSVVTVIFIMTDNSKIYNEGYELVIPEKGVYFVYPPSAPYVTGISSVDSGTPEIVWDGNIETIKTIDPKYIPADHINSLIDAKLGVIENGSY